MIELYDVEVALGAICAVHQHKLRVPEDIAVVGFDNIDEGALLNALADHHCARSARHRAVGDGATVVA